MMRVHTTFIGKSAAASAETPVTEASRAFISASVEGSIV